MNLLKVTCITSHLGSGGAERNLLRLAEWLAEEGHAVTLLTLDPDCEDFYPCSEHVTRRIAKTGSFLSCPWYDLRCQRKRKAALRESIIETTPDLVISFIDTTNITVLAALAGCYIPTIVSERTEPQFHQIGWRWSLLRRYYYPRAEKVVFVSKASATWAKNRYAKWSSMAIPNAVLKPQTRAQVPEWFALRNWLAMGRLSEEKQFDLLINAFAEVATEFPDWNLTILGEGPERENLEKLIQTQHMQDRIKLPGTIVEPSSVLQAADAFILTSRYEGFPNVLLEAMACGLPVVSFACPHGPAEIIRHGQDGLLIDSGNIPALLDVMKVIMKNSELRQKLASKAPEVLSRFSAKRIKEMWVSLMAELMDR